MKRAKYKIVMMILALALMIPGVAAYADNGPAFSDVGSTFWAKDEIDSLVQLGVVKGFDDNTFKPAAPVTREQFAQLLTLAFYLDIPTDNEQSFRDVATTRWSFPAIEAAKDFLTGYYPPSGKAFFDPTAKATREDVAVALVKTMNYQPDDLKNPNILDSYYDGDDVSPNLQTYMGIAIEKKLLTGYQDGRLKPGAPVTRAEAAALIYRVLKGASGDSQASLELNVDVPEKTSTPTVYVTGDVTKGASVSINNKQVEVVQGQFRWAVVLEQEGTYTLTIVARMPGGKTETVTKKVVFEKGGPTLEVKGVPEQTDNKTLKVSWTAKDPNGSNLTVYLNGEKQWSASSSATIELEEGVNTIIVRAENESGKTAEVKKQVLVSTGGPALTVDLPETTDKESVTVRWTVKDKNDASPVVYVNDEKQSSYGNSVAVKLKEGSNSIIVKATNKFGKTTTVTKTIIFNAGNSALTVGDLPETTEKESVTVSWSVKDTNDSAPAVYVNDEQQGSYYTSKSITLVPGVNTIKVKSVNKLGKATEVVKTITFNPPAPAFVLTHAPETTSSPKITVSWTLTDVNDSSAKLYMNDAQLSSYYSSISVDLKEGDNVFKFVATNKYGKSTEVLYKVTYTAVQPEQQS
ncbi:S-layer homology domain-containing protein [Paenibacillus oryzae]|nr:S-layer homology domain-containing protein [Paenibacillus oryzae]